MTKKENKKQVTINTEEVNNRTIFVVAVLTVQIIIDILLCGFKEHIRKAHTNRTAKFLLGVLTYFIIVLSCADVEE